MTEQTEKHPVQLLAELVAVLADNVAALHMRTEAIVAPEGVQDIRATVKAMFEVAQQARSIAKSTR
jgi:hypothetical protein